MPDISAHNAPKSTQLDNIELRGKGSQIFTITRVDVKSPDDDQPVLVHLAEFPRPWKPGKNMRRALSHCWTAETDNWVGKRVELYADESVKFGNDTPGGTRLSRVSDIDKTVHAPILLGQGKPGTWKVDPLPDAPTPTPKPLATQIADMLANYESTFNVTRTQLEAHLALPADDWTPETLDELRVLGGELKRGDKAVADVFGAEGGA